MSNQNLGESLDIGDLESAIEAAALDAAREAAKSESYDVECPHCGAGISIKPGISKCPKCGGEIKLDLSFDF